MATRNDVAGLLRYLGADADVNITEERVNVWYDQFKEQDSVTLKQAARLLLAKKVYGKFPRVADMWAAIKELSSPDEETWVTAWELGLATMRRHGFYNRDKAAKELEEKHPMARRAFGTMMDEYYQLNTEDLPTFRAQFRQRFEALVQSDARKIFRPSQQIAGEFVTRLLGNMPQQIGNEKK